jgi:hypothetical protein
LLCVGAARPHVKRTVETSSRAVDSIVRQV